VGCRWSRPWTRFPTAWQWIPPAITTVMFVLAVNFVGDGIRDALDPRTLFEK
jgi:ABC-type dipeptide/oligopeptide/nickel transport system permease subunit